MSKNSDLPSINIITPSFNQGQFIEETIQSVLSQHYPNLQYWVIDGGSTDNTLEILKKYQKHLKWVSEKDRGQTHAINKGMEKVSGEIVAYLNSDDVYLPNTLLTVGEFFRNHPDAKWFTGDYFIIDEHGQKIQSYVASYKKWLRQHPTLFTLAIANYIIQPSTFWRRSVVKEVGDFNEELRYCMDFDFWLRVMKKYPLAVTDRHFSLFRIHGNSKGGLRYDQQFAEEHQIVQKYISSPIIRGLHWLHAQAIVQAYHLIK